VLLAVPALRALKAAQPSAAVVLAAQPWIGSLLAALGAIDAHRSFDALGLETLFVDDGRPARVEALQAASRVVCWFGARDPVFVSRLAQTAPGAIVAAPAGDGTVAVWEHLLQAVAAPAGDWCGALAVPPALRADGHRALRAAGWDGATPLLLVHPGAGGPDKRWPTAGFARALAGVVEERRVSVVIHAGPADRDAAATLASELGGTPLRLDEPPLPRLAGALSHAAAYLGNDSGISHAAAAVGVPSLILFEAAKLAWRPWCAVARPLVVNPSALEAGDVSAVVAGARALLG
jgi:ADP-heptose:LPS heptosyltransferase